MVEGRVVDVEKEANLNMYTAECHEEATPVMLFARKPGWLRDNEILFVDRAIPAGCPQAVIVS